jgi:hypothetical protein
MKIGNVNAASMTPKPPIPLQKLTHARLKRAITLRCWLLAVGCWLLAVGCWLIKIPLTPYTMQAKD